MGDGLVLEQGTHSELLRNEHGPYSRLVTAQKLREQRAVDSDSSKETEKKARNGILVGRRNSGHPPSDIMDQKEKLRDFVMKEDDHSLSYVFMRIGKLNPVGWRKYGLGVIVACGIHPPYIVNVRRSN
jgi:ATP-binding cassette, subfamily B (MDR/TAP), member 1